MRRLLLAVWLTLVVILLALIFLTTGSPFTPALSAMLGATITGGAALVGVQMTLDRQDRRTKAERVRTAYRQLIRSANRIITVVDELTDFPRGRGPGSRFPAVDLPPGQDPMAKANALAEEAQDLVLEARITLSLELFGDEEVYDAFEAVDSRYWSFIAASQENDREKAAQDRNSLKSDIERLITAAREHLTRLEGSGRGV